MMKRRLKVLGQPNAVERDGSVRMELPDGTGFSLPRRDVLRLGAAAAAAAGLAGCAPQPEEIRPRHVRPEQAPVGQALQYATACFACPAGCGLMAVTREGRVIKADGNREHPVGLGALCARGQATVLDLYDAYRIRKSLRLSRGKHPPQELARQSTDEQAVQALSKLRGKDTVRLLTGSVHGPGTRALINEFLTLFPGSKHIAWEPLAPVHQAVADAQARTYGEALFPQYRLDKADLIVAFGSEFLDTMPSPVHMARAFSVRRDPDHPEGMSKLVVFEGRMSLTGSNADKRYRVRPSQLAAVALSLAHAILVENKHGPLAQRPDLVASLAGLGAAEAEKHTGVPASEIRALASSLIAHAGRSVVIGAGPSSTGATGQALEVAINLINSALGNDGKTIDYAHPMQHGAGTHAQLAELAHDMRTGKVEALIIWGTNPAYAAPMVLGFTEAMGHVPMVVSIADGVDETARGADLVIAAAHPLESWLDAQPVRGVVTVGQPAMQPLGEMRSIGDVLAAWAHGLEPNSKLGQTHASAQQDGGVASASYHFLRAYWREHIYAKAGGGRDFETFWRDALHAGVVVLEQDREAASLPREVGQNALAGLLPVKPETGEMELVLFAPHNVYDGRGANNAWLLEYPDPVTRIAWSNWAGLSRKRMAQMGLENGDYVDVHAAGAWIRLPACEVLGQHDDVISVALGWGRGSAGEVGQGLGASGYLLTAMTAHGTAFAGHAATIKKASGRAALAIPQGHAFIDLGERPLIPYTAVSAYRADPKSGTEAPKAELTIWPEHKYETRWGMAIDLSKCIGCGACTIACQAENNIPTAGHKGVVNGREMHWLRVDRYIKMPVPRTAKTIEEVAVIKKSRENAERDRSWSDEPEVVHHPLMCQHCENAPCETVCPVGATNHSADGLNVQVYNRCVGTRYCSNNCPFKARRFNWFDYSRDRDNWLSRLFEPALPVIAKMNTRWPLQLKNNPEVTVRSRGVMEKCTFCVQRITVARGRAKDENRKVQDGDVVTACQQACPTQAIVFGNLADPQSAVSKLRQAPRGLHMLNDQNVRTSVTYLTKVRNDEG